MDCLVAIGSQLRWLNSEDKECYYSEVKNLVRIIQEEKKCPEVNSQFKADVDMDGKDNQESEAEIERRGIDNRNFYKIGNKFVPKHIYLQMIQDSNSRENSITSPPRLPSNNPF